MQDVRTPEQIAADLEASIQADAKVLEEITREREDAFKSFEVREHEVQERTERFQGALRALRPGPSHVVGSTRKASVKAPAKRGRPAGTGKRRQDVLALMADDKSRTIPDMGVALDMKDNYLYRVVPTLVEEKLLRKSKRAGKAFYKATPKLHEQLAPAEVAA